MLWRRLLALSLATMLASGNALAAGPGQAATSAPTASDHDIPSILAELRALSAELEYDRVISQGRKLLLRGDLTDAQRTEGLLLLGSALVFIGDSGSKDVFDELLRLHPDYSLPPGSERKVAVAFADAQQRKRDAIAAGRRAYVRDMVIETPDLRVVEAGAPLVFEFTIRDPGHYVRKAAVKYRLADKGDYLALALQQPPGDASTWSGSIPGSWTANKGGADVQWFFTTADAAGEPLVTVADARAPRTLHIDTTVAKPPGKPIYTTWWFWTAIGAAAVATTTVLIATHSGAKSPPGSDLGTVVLK